MLSVGPRKAGFDESGKPFFWDVTPQDLQLIAMCFGNAQQNGVAFNLTNSHGDPRTCIVPTQDIISPIDEVIVEDGVLWISSYVTPEVAIELQNPAMKVSPGIKPDFMDGEGHVYPLQLYHVAVVDNPVVPRQGAFLAMANTQATGDGSMDETILGWFKQIFEYEEMPIPESVTPDNAMDILPVLIEQLVGSESDEEPADTAAEGEGDPASAPAGEVVTDPVTMKNAQAPAWAQTLINGQKALNARLDQIETGSKRELFEAKASSLVASGRITEAQAIQMTNAAAKTGYDTSLLDIFGGGAPVTGKAAPVLGRQSRTLSNPQQQTPPSIAPDLKPEEVTKAADELIGGANKRRKQKSMA